MRVCSVQSLLKPFNLLLCTAMAREVPPPGVWGAKSPDHKRPRHKDLAPTNAASSTLTTLSPQELTRAVVAHDEALRSLQAQLSLTFKLDPSCPLADKLLRTVKSWQAEHKRGQAHPQGSCSTAVLSALLEFLTNTQDSSLSDDPEALSAVRCVMLLPAKDDLGSCRTEQRAQVDAEVVWPHAQAIAPHDERAE